MLVGYGCRGGATLDCESRHASRKTVTMSGFESRIPAYKMRRGRSVVACARRAALLGAVWLGGAGAGVAQYTTGAIGGSVADATGAEVRGAAVTLRNEATGEVRRSVSAAGGAYLFPALTPGTYTLVVAAPGFGEVRAEIAATSSATVTENVTVRPESQSTVVEVSGVSPEVNLADAQLTTTRNQVEISALPNQARIPEGLVTLEPAVTPMYSPRGGASLVAISGAQTGQIAAYGGRGRATAYSLDYTDINDWEFGGYALGTQPSIDMIAEQKVFTGVYPAEFGLESSNVVAITRSGSNALHGSVYDFLQNDAFNARDYFDTSGKATATKQNIYGFNVGGPIWRDRTFFFGGYEKTSTRGAGTTVGLLFPNANAVAAATDPAARQLLGTLLPFVPAPAVSDPTGLTTGVTQVFTGPAESSLYLVRGDHRISDKHSVSVRYLYSSGTQTLPFPTFNAPAGYGALLVTGTHSVNVSETSLLSANAVNEVRVAYGRSLGQLPPEAQTVTPRFNINGVINLGEYQAFEQGRLFNTYQVADAFSWQRGRHALKFGADVRYIQDQSTNVSGGRGIYTFASLPDFLAGTFSGYSQTFGGTTRNYRTWVPGFFAQDEWRAAPTLTISAGLRFEPQGALKETHGLLSILDASGQGVAVGDAGTGALGAFRGGDVGIAANYGNVQPRLSVAWNPGGGRAVLRAGYGVFFDDFNFALLSNIRVSPPLNYSVQLSGPVGGNTLDALVGGSAPIQTATEQQIGSFGTLRNFGAATTVPKKLANPYTQNFTAGMQVQLTPKTVFSVDYLGSVSRKLTDVTPLNEVRVEARPAPAVSVADETARLAEFQAVAAAENGAGSGIGNNRLDPRFNQVDGYAAVGTSNYNGLAVQVKQAAAHGLQAQFAYTYAKSLDDDSDFNVAQIGQDLSYPQGAGAALRRAEYGPSNFDIQHRVILTTVWQVPFFPAQRGVVGHVLGGWSFSTIEQWQSGVPATLLNGSRLGIADVNGDGSLTNGLDNTRVSVRPGGHDFHLSKAATVANTTGVNPFLADASLRYVPTLLGNNGTLGRDTFRMPSLPNVDWSLVKETTLTERSWAGSAPPRLQVRADAFDVFNLPFLTATGSNWNTISSPAFGLVNAAGNMRKVQIAAKITF